MENNAARLFQEELLGILDANCSSCKSLRYLRPLLKFNIVCNPTQNHRKGYFSVILSKI